MSGHDTRRLNYKQQPDTSPQIIRNGESYDLDTREHMDNGVSVHMCPNGSLQNLARHSKASQVFSDGFSDGENGMGEQDTREKLEADILAHYKTPEEKLKTVREWLDRQAAITERGASEWHNKFCAWCEQVTDGRIAELTAEVEKQRQRANDAERGVLSDKWYVARDRYKDDVAELTAERDELQAAIDAMENGQFYAMYRQACQERDHLKKVVRTHAESFRKMEADLHALNSGETLNTLRASVAGLKDTVEKQKAEIERLRDENAELNMQVHGSPF